MGLTEKSFLERNEEMGIFKTSNEKYNKSDGLISRAAAIGCLGNSPEQMCMPWSEVERILRELPAVDAIPVEWLRQYAPEKWSMYMQAAAEIIIDAWQKEQEARS